MKPRYGYVGIKALLGERKVINLRRQGKKLEARDSGQTTEISLGANPLASRE